MSEAKILNSKKNILNLSGTVTHAAAVRLRIQKAGRQCHRIQNYRDVGVLNDAIL